MEIVFLAIGLLIGALAAWLLKGSQANVLRKEIEAARQMGEANVETERRIAQEQIANEKRLREADAAVAQEQIANEKRLREADAENAQKLRKQMEQQLQEVKETAERMRKESDAQWSLKLEALKKELMHKTTEQMAQNQESLRESNKSNIEELMKPLKEQFELFKRSVDESRTQSEVNKNDIKQKFDSAMQLFKEQQELAIRQLANETTKIGNDAVNLAKALKSNTKKQGNWGEMVLETMLENSGLEENVHYFLQYNVKDEEGKRNIPDVVIKFPEGRSVIIDSKVSLTAYTESFETEDEDKRQELMKAHLRSVQRHVDELSIKNYPRVVENSMDYVLMFIPNESSYVAAMKMDPDLLHDAYERKVIVISPNNLMMALQLAFNLWQNDKQIKNVEKIAQRGKLLYEKVSTFQSTFEAIGKSLDQMHAAYDKAKSQMYDGPGSIVKQCRTLEDLGVKVESKKRLKGVEGLSKDANDEGE